MRFFLVFFISVLFQYSTVFAQYFCVDLLSITPHVANNVLGQWGLNLYRPVVQQCRGSCYFEGSVGSIENLVSKAMGKRIYISRPLLIKALLLIRTDHYLRTLDSDIADIGAQLGISHLKANMEQEDIDILSGGESENIHELVNTSRLNSTSKPTALSVYNDSKAIEEMYQVTRVEVYKAQLQITSRKTGARPTPSEIQRQTKQFLTEEFDRILAKYNLLEVVNLPKYRFSYSEPLVEFDSIKKRLVPETEKRLIEQLKKSGEIPMDYLHVKDYVVRDGEHSGYLKLPTHEKPKNLSDFTEEDVKKRRAGMHHTAVVDFLLDAEGRISHLVVRQAWGSHNSTHHGYMYISTEYLFHFKTGLFLFWKIF